MLSFKVRTFIDEDLEYIPDFPQWTLEHLSKVSLSKQSILHRLVKLDTAKVPGPDRIHLCVLKNFSKQPDAYRSSAWTVRITRWVNSAVNCGSGVNVVF